MRRFLAGTGIHRGKAFAMWRGAMLSVLCIAACHMALAEEVSAEAPADAMPDEEMYGPTTRDDTLWSIAREVRAPGATLGETVSALQRMNPHAFVEGNPNLLMRGVMLKVPTTAAAVETPTDAERLEPESVAPAEESMAPAEESPAPEQEEIVRGEDVPALPATGDGDRELLALQNAELRKRLETVQTELEVVTARAEALDGQISTLRRRLAESETQVAAAQSPVSEEVAAGRRNAMTGIALALLVVVVVVFMYARRRRAGQPVGAEPVQQPLGARRIGARRLAPEAIPDDYDPSTKLNLARAFLDMGRTDQAREVLEEVLAEGSDDDRREAEELLEQME